MIARYDSLRDKAYLEEKGESEYQTYQKYKLSALCLVQYSVFIISSKINTIFERHYTMSVCFPSSLDQQHTRSNIMEKEMIRSNHPSVGCVRMIRLYYPFVKSICIIHLYHPFVSSICIIHLYYSFAFCFNIKRCRPEVGADATTVLTEHLYIRMTLSRQRYFTHLILLVDVKHKCVSDGVVVEGAPPPP